MNSIEMASLETEHQKTNPSDLLPDQFFSQTYPLNQNTVKPEGGCCNRFQRPLPMKKSGYILTIDSLNIWLFNPADAYVVIFTLVWFTILTIYFYFVLMRNYPESLMGFVNIPFMFLHLFTFIRGVTTEPGVIPRNIIAILPQSEDDVVISFTSRENTIPESPKNKQNDPENYYKSRYCSTCKIQRIPKASHCSHCGNCVKGFDHHCTFFGNCIGERNLKYFYGWLWSMTLQGAIWFFVAVPLLYNQFDYKFYSTLIVNNSFPLVLIGLIGFCCCWSCFCVRRSFQGCYYTIVMVSMILYAYYYSDKTKPFYKNYFSTFLFLMSSIPLFLYALIMTIKYTQILGLGLTVKEDSVKRKLNKENESLMFIKGISNICELIFRENSPSEIFD